MRIIVVDLNGPFGPLRSYVELVPEFQRRGVDVEFIVPSRSIPLLLDLAPQSVVHIIDRPHSVSRDWKISQIVRQRLRNGVGIVHANSTSAVRGAALGAVPAGAPLVVHLRNSRLSRGEEVVLQAVALLAKRVVFIAVSDGAARTAQRLPQNAVSLIGDPVSAPEARGARGLGDPPHIGLVLNQLPTKGLDIFAEIAVALSTSDIQWEVFGSAGLDPAPPGYVRESRARLSRFGLDARVLFHGVVPSMSERFVDLDVFLVTSRRESFSRVCAEALRSGVPLVAPDIPGLIDTVGGGRFAHMYPVENSEAAASAVQFVLSDYAAALKIAGDGMCWGTQQFSPGVIAEQLIERYEAL